MWKLQPVSDIKQMPTFWSVWEIFHTAHIYKWNKVSWYNMRNYCKAALWSVESRLFPFIVSFLFKKMGWDLQYGNYFANSHVKGMLMHINYTNELSLQSNLTYT